MSILPDRKHTPSSLQKQPVNAMLGNDQGLFLKNKENSDTLWAVDIQCRNRSSTRYICVLQ